MKPRPGVRQSARFVWGQAGVPHLVLGELRVSPRRRRRPPLPSLLRLSLAGPQFPPHLHFFFRATGGTLDKHLSAPIPKHKKKASDGSEKSRCPPLLWFPEARTALDHC